MVKTHNSLSLSQLTLLLSNFKLGVQAEPAESVLTALNQVDLVVTPKVF
jgi:hypothetical protein